MSTTEERIAKGTLPENRQEKPAEENKEKPQEEQSPEAQLKEINSLLEDNAGERNRLSNVAGKHEQDLKSVRERLGLADAEYVPDPSIEERGEHLDTHDQELSGAFSEEMERFTEYNRRQHKREAIYGVIRDFSNTLPAEERQSLIEKGTLQNGEPFVSESLGRPVPPESMKAIAKAESDNPDNLSEALIKMTEPGSPVLEEMDGEFKQKAENDAQKLETEIAAGGPPEEDTQERQG